MSAEPPVYTEAHRRAADRLRAARGSINEAFDALGCGIDHERAVDRIQAAGTANGGTNQ